VSEGGLAVALAEAALYSGVGAALELPDDPVTLFGEGGGQAIVASSPAQGEIDPEGVSVRRIGTVGGETILGVEISALRAAWEGSEPS
jgi:phosphoribosylformylglycinamidine (FGAM) synthase-like enzyme